MERGVQCAECAAEFAEFVGRAEQVCPLSLLFSITIPDMYSVKCESSKRTSSGVVGFGPSRVQEISDGEASRY